MKPNSPSSVATFLQDSSVDGDGQTFVLSLFISGISPKSALAVKNIKRICETKLQGRYTLEIIDIYQQPLLAQAHQIVAAPTLIKRSPLPLRRLIGDMSNEAKVLSGLELE
jgi:circadian clock protein KaiB